MLVVPVGVGMGMTGLVAGCSPFGVFFDSSFFLKGK